MSSSARLAELCSQIVDCPHSTPLWTETGEIVLRSQNIRNGRLNLSSRSFTTEIEYRNRSRRAEIRAGDIVITREAPMGEVCMIPAGLRCCLGQRMVLLRPHQERVIGRYLLYALQSPVVQREILMNEGTGATVSNLRIPILSSLAIPTPSLSEQRAIAAILGACDDKIELNREMSATLEAMARALFKSWFIDFDPVRAKSEGRDPGLPAEIAALFPDSFEDSELGEIPKGWQYASIYEAADVIYGAPFASEYFNSQRLGRPLIRIRDLKSQTPEVYTPEEHSRGYLAQPGDLLVGMDGEFRPYMWTGPCAWMNQRVCCFKPKNGNPRAYVHLAIESLLGEVERSETATTVIHLGKADIDRFRVIEPPTPLLAAFGGIANALESRTLAAFQESRTLGALRDALLPKLISGELRIRDAERLVEQSA